MVKASYHKRKELSGEETTLGEWWTMSSKTALSGFAADLILQE